MKLEMECSKLEDFHSLIPKAQSFLKDRYYTEAEDLYNRAISILENGDISVNGTLKTEIYNEVGYLCYKNVEFKKALSYYNKAIKLNGSYGPAYYNRGTIYYRLGFFEPAIKDMEMAVLLNSENEQFKTALEACKVALKLESAKLESL